MSGGMECPSCSKQLSRGQVSCPCGWKLPKRPDKHDQARNMAAHFFTSQDDLNRYESFVSGEHSRADLALIARRAEINALPIHRQWAKKILIREEAGDKTVTVAALEMARAALGVTAPEKMEVGAEG